MDKLNIHKTTGNSLSVVESSLITSKLNDMASFFGSKKTNKIISNKSVDINILVSVLNISNEAIANLSKFKNNYKSYDYFLAVDNNDITDSIDSNVDFVNKTNLESLNGLFSYPLWWDGIEIPVTFVNGVATHDYDVTDNVSDLLSTTPYYISINGDDSNNGLSELTALKNLQKAIDLGAKNINIANGIYDRGIFEITPITADISIIGGSDVFVTTHESFSWVTYNSIFKTTGSIVSIIDRLDFDEYGFRHLYEWKDSVVLVENTSGSWYTDGVDVYVNPITTVEELITNTNIQQDLDFDVSITTPLKMYLENITFSNTCWVSSRTSTVINNRYMYMKNVKVPYPCRNDFETLDIRWSIHTESLDTVFQNCLSYRASRDGFSYHNDYLVRNTNMVEIDCISFNPSFRSGSTSNQASSTHHGIKGLRIGGIYTNGFSVIRDVDLGSETKSLLIGCTLNQQRKWGTNNNLEILAVSRGEAYGCKLLGIEDSLDLEIECIEVGAELKLNKCYSEHTVLVGNVIIVN